MKNKNALDAVVDAIIQAAGEIDDTTYFNDAINVAERLHVSLICMFVISVSKKHEDHDCNFAESLPEYIDVCKSDFIKALDWHMDVNCAMNGIELYKSHNQKVMESIMAQMKDEAELELEEAYHNYTCPICLDECTEYETCGCEQDVNLPKD